MFIATVIACGLPANFNYVEDGCGVMVHKQLFMDEAICKSELEVMRDYAFDRLPSGGRIHSAECAEVGNEPNT